jgi:voltage-gated potassium channel
MKAMLNSERKKLLISITNLLEGPMILLAFVWLVLLIVELISGLDPALQFLSIAIWIVFVIDFLLKLILAPQKLRFLRSNWLTAVSLVIPAFRLFRILRILRLFRGIRLIRVVSSLNRSMKSLGATMKRRGFGYVVLLALVVIFGGAAGMYGIEKGHQGFENYGMSLWWTAMRVITAGSEAWPLTSEGRALAFVLALFGYAIFGYVTATLATFFIGRDAEEKTATVAGAKDIEELKTLVLQLSQKLDHVKMHND